MVEMQCKLDEEIDFGAAPRPRASAWVYVGLEFESGSKTTMATFLDLLLAPCEWIPSSQQSSQSRQRELGMLVSSIPCFSVPPAMRASIRYPLDTIYQGCPK